MLRSALDRRYLLPEIRIIHGMKLDSGFLEFDVATEDSRHQFTIRSTN
jgi:hypothetical protein